jgi:hypothetical protein
MVLEFQSLIVGTDGKKSAPMGEWEGLCEIYTNNQ